MGRVFLTFDVEDFINNQSIHSLFWVLQLLKLNDLKGTFFITGHMAEILTKYRPLLNLLEDNTIGYHSSSHSVRPLIPEFTDVENYSRAIQISLKREQSHIDPFTGEIQGTGGILLLRKIFKNKNICSFRAPGFCWTPPHSEALAKMGIVYDFSSSIHYSIAFKYVTKNMKKEINFFPTPLFLDQYLLLSWPVFLKWMIYLFKRMLFFDITVLLVHPASLVNTEHWGKMFLNGNPKTLYKVEKRPKNEIDQAFIKLGFLLYFMKLAHKKKLINVTANLKPSDHILTKSQIKIEKIYRTSIFWPRYFFSYEPVHLKRHFYSFFQR